VVLELILSLFVGQKTKGEIGKLISYVVSKF
jgi:hypothetical protein